MPLSRVVVTGGGTAGHVVPAIPVVEALSAQGCEVHFVGGVEGPERGLMANLPAIYHGVRTGKLRRYLSMQNLLDCFRIPLGVFQAWQLLRRIAPEVVFSKGGFASFPAVLGAWLNGIPVVAHESDLTPGLANRLALPFVAALCLNFDASTMARRRLRTVVTGTPLRRQLLEGDARRGRALLGIDGGAERPVLLVVGGSQGAARLNEVLRAALPELLKSHWVVHVCGPGRTAAGYADQPGYMQVEYVDDGWGDVIAAAGLVVSRAGANALSEWLTLGVPHLLVPLPKTASRGDQLENAAFAAANGWSLVIEEHELDAATLLAGIAKLADDAPDVRRRLQTFRTRDSTALILDELERAAASSRRARRTGRDQRHPRTNQGS